MEAISFRNIEELRDWLRSGWTAKHDSSNVSHETGEGRTFELPDYNTTYMRPHRTDHLRVANIIESAAGLQIKMIKLASMQAEKITNPGKALRRAWAALEMNPKQERISAIFYKRYLKLSVEESKVPF